MGKGGILFLLFFVAASLMLIGSIDGLFTSPSEAVPSAPAAAYSANETFMEETIAEPPPRDIVSSNASALECVSIPGEEESVNESVPANDTVMINASMLVSCRCRTCHSSDDGKKKLFGENSATTTIPREITTTSTTTTLKDPSSATSTTTLADNTTTTSIPFTATTTSLPQRSPTTTARNDETTTSTPVKDATTTTSVTSTTRSEGTTTTTSATTTTTIPSADEFSSGWFALAILFFAPAFTYLAAKRG